MDTAGETREFVFTLRRHKGWETHVIVQHNAAEGSGSIRRGQLDIAAGSARTSYFFGVENTDTMGSIVQSSLGLSYLPNSLLKDGDADGRRETYVGVVGKLAARWPQRNEGIRFRAGIEVGYAPETPTSAAAGIDTNVDGLAWNAVASLMDFRPSHNIGVNYGRTGAGWLLSPNFAQNEELFELRYQWRPANFPSENSDSRHG